MEQPAVHSCLIESITKITSTSGGLETMRRDLYGSLVPRQPFVRLTVELCGTWGSQEAERQDIDFCIKEMLGAYEARKSRGDKQSS